MIHLLCPTLCKLMNALQRKFVRKIKLSSDDTITNVYINVGDDRKIKPFSKIDVGMKAKTLLSQNVMMASDKRRSFAKIALIFWSLLFRIFGLTCLMTCLYCNMPNIFTLINTLNLAVKFTSVLNNNNCFYKVFGVKSSSTDSIVD